MSPTIIFLGANVLLSALNALLAARNGDAFGGWLMAMIAWLVAMSHALEGGAA